MGRIRGSLEYLAGSGRVNDFIFHSSFRCKAQALLRRFPVISGMRVTWDSRKDPGQRVLNIALQVQKKIDEHSSGDSTPNLTIEYQEISRVSDRKYAVITREYMADGHDGFDVLKGQKMLIDDEQGQMMSTIVRKYLLGSTFFLFQ